MQYAVYGVNLSDWLNKKVRLSRHLAGLPLQAGLQVTGLNKVQASMGIIFL